MQKDLIICLILTSDVIENSQIKYHFCIETDDSLGKKISARSPYINNNNLLFWPTKNLKFSAQFHFKTPVKKLNSNLRYHPQKIS